MTKKTKKLQKNCQQFVAEATKILLLQFVTQSYEVIFLHRKSDNTKNYEIISHNVIYTARRKF